MCCSGLTSRGCWVSPERLPPFKVTQSFNKHVNIFRLPCKKMSPSALVGLFGRFKFKPNSQLISTFLSHKKNGQKPKSWVEFHVKNIVTSPISLSQIYCKLPRSLSFFLFLINPKVFDTNNPFIEASTSAEWKRRKRMQHYTCSTSLLSDQLWAVLAILTSWQCLYLS